MIVLLLIYLAFQILFDHWGDNSVYWKVVYFAFQYGWVALLSVYLCFKSQGRERLFYFIFAIMMSVISVNELVYLNEDKETYAMMSATPPAYLLTFFAVILFIIFEIIMRWRNK